MHVVCVSAEITCQTLSQGILTATFIAINMMMMMMIMMMLLLAAYENGFCEELLCICIIWCLKKIDRTATIHNIY